MKNIYIFIFFGCFINPSFSQKFYYSNNQKIYLQEDKNYLLVVPNIEINSYNTNIIQPLYGVYFSSSEIQNNFGLIKLQLKDTSLGTLAINNLKSNTSTKYVWYAMYTKNNIPIIPTNEILFRPKLSSTIKMFSNLKLTANSIDTSYFIAQGISNDSVVDLANQYYESGNAVWCHPNFWAPMEKFTNDPLYVNQYYLKNTGQNGGVAGIDINVENAWNITKGSSNIKVAVIDEGVEDHEDFSGRVLNGYTPRNPSNNGRPVGTANGHGVACTGIIAATQDNNKDIAGIAPLVKVVPVNIFYGGETANDNAAAINWAWNQGQADILSNSWGYVDPSVYFDVIANAIQNARANGRGGKGSIVVFASGNAYDRQARFPGNVNGVISVGAIDKTGSLWNYSCGGSSLDLVAPTGDVNLAGDVSTTDRMGTNGYVAGNYLNTFGGTSAACPQVSGVVALLISINPNLTEVQIANILHSSATDMGPLGFDNDYGYGRLNACSAVNQALTTLPISGIDKFCTSSSYSVTLPSNVSVVSWSATPSGIVNLSPSGNSVTLTKISSGIITLSANLNSSCGAGSSILKNNISVGTPTTTCQEIGNGICNKVTFLCPSEMNNWQYVVIPGTWGTGGTGYHLQVNGGGYFNNGLTTQDITTTSFSVFVPTGGNNVTIWAMNSCGVSQNPPYVVAFAPKTSGCTGGFAVSPNPASSSLTIALIDKSVSNKAGFNQIQIVDKLGSIKKHYKYSVNMSTITINISDLPTDIYIVRIFNGVTWEEHKIIVQK